MKSMRCSFEEKIFIANQFCLKFTLSGFTSFRTEVLSPIMFKVSTNNEVCHFQQLFWTAFFWTAIRYFNPSARWKPLWPDRLRRKVSMPRPSPAEKSYVQIFVRSSSVFCAFFDFCRLRKFERTTPPFLRSGHTWSRLGPQPG